MGRVLIQSEQDERMKAPILIEKKINGCFDAISLDLQDDVELPR